MHHDESERPKFAGSRNNDDVRYASLFRSLRTRQRVEYLRAQKQMQIDKECTFRPNVSATEAYNAAKGAKAKVRSRLAARSARRRERQKRSAQSLRRRAREAHASETGEIIFGRRQSFIGRHSYLTASTPKYAYHEREDDEDQRQKREHPSSIPLPRSLTSGDEQNSDSDEWLSCEGEGDDDGDGVADQQSSTIDEELRQKQRRCGGRRRLGRRRSLQKDPNASAEH